MKKLNIILFIILVVAVAIMFVLFKYMGDKKLAKANYPFFASTRYVTSNIRSGPGKEYPILWVYQKKHTPVKVLLSYNGWYQIEDYSGKIGWIFQNTTTKDLSAFTKEKILVYKSSNQKSKQVASIDKNIIVMIDKVDDTGNYYKISLLVDKTNITGWALKDKFWGGYIQ
ncbi:SH3 domain-containing protein [Rickettsiales bacterium LUAb2]